MHSDTVGESTQGHTYLPLATQAASSDDCSAVNLETTTAAQDDNISTLAQHVQQDTAQPGTAQQGLPLPAGAQHHKAADGAHTVSNSHKSLRKRKKPEQSIPPPNQMQIGPSTSNQAANGTQSEIADAQADKGSLPVNLASVVSCRKGKWKGHKLSEGQFSLEASQGSAHSLPSSTGTAAGTLLPLSCCSMAVLHLLFHFPPFVHVLHSCPLLSKLHCHSCIKHCYPVTQCCCHVHSGGQKHASFHARLKSSHVRC